MQVEIVRPEVLQLFLYVRNLQVLDLLNVTLLNFFRKQICAGSILGKEEE